MHFFFAVYFFFYYHLSLRVDLAIMANYLCHLILGLELQFLESLKGYIIQRIRPATGFMYAGLQRGVLIKQTTEICVFDS